MNDLYKVFASVYESSDWIKGANCLGMDTKLFFPELGENITSFAREVCFSCDVQDECLWYANQTRSTDGLFGGFTPNQREEWRVKNSITLGQSKEQWKNRNRGYLHTPPSEWSEL